MTRTDSLRPQFVEFIPRDPEEGILYISIPYATAIHICCCGCGNKVVTPFSPAEWKLVFDGRSVSLDPSIGNWNFPCQSHYWVTNNQIRWARRFLQHEIDEVKECDERAITDYFAKSDEQEQTRSSAAPSRPEAQPAKPSLLERIFRRSDRGGAQHKEIPSKIKGSAKKRRR